MNKPISKHALRRAMEKMIQQGYVQLSEPLGATIDRIWHELEKRNYNGARKRPPARQGVRPGLAEHPEAGAPEA